MRIYRDIKKITKLIGNIGVPFFFYSIHQHFLLPETLKASILSNFSNAINAKNNRSSSYYNDMCTIYVYFKNRNIL